MTFNLKTLVLTILLAIGFSFQNCSSDVICSCPDIAGEFFDIQGLMVDSYGMGPNINGALLTENDTLKFEEYAGLQLQYQVEYVTSNCSGSKSWGFSLMNSALACSCLENGYRGSKDEYIEDISILTLNDFDEDHLANEPINDLFEVTMIDEQDLNEYLLQDDIEIRYESLRLALNKAPVLDKEFKVRVILSLSSNEEYIAESLPITIID